MLPEWYNETRKAAFALSAAASGEFRPRRYDSTLASAVIRDSLVLHCVVMENVTEATAVIRRRAIHGAAMKQPNEYPAPPWRLAGEAWQSLKLVRTEYAQAIAPEGLQIVSLLPGRTLGGLFLARYGSGSDLEYSELMVIAGLATIGHSRGMWVSHIYVDSDESRAGGREIWGLPKELAEFEWPDRAAGTVRVRQGDRLLCEASPRGGRLRMPIRYSSFALGLLKHDPVIFRGSLRSRATIRNAEWSVPSDAPFASLGLSGRSLTLHHTQMSIIAEAPRLV